ncbi:abortive infection family protein [Levilactobacillus zymae]|uniref:abortive infection family protein n=1 Tax=Levilactobacillus zymae TaxID=267363 RepID=UPI000B3FD582|nr:abortive infection family protein [Levilactobacillus zymae]
MDYFPRINYPEIEQFDVISVTEHFTSMNVAFNNADYSKTINFAKSMLESTVRWVYLQVKGEDMKDGGSLYSKTKDVIKLLKPHLIGQEFVEEILDKQMDIIGDVGRVRNYTAESHGHADRVSHFEKAQAQYIMYTATANCNFLLELYYYNTHSAKENAVGSPITVQDNFKKLDNLYRDDDAGITYCLEETTKIIRQVIIELKVAIDPDIDGEFFREHIDPFMEDDAQQEKHSIQTYTFYSKKRDLHYTVDLTGEGKLIYITKEYPD